MATFTVPTPRSSASRGRSDDVAQWSKAQAVIIGAPFDGGTSHRAAVASDPGHPIDRLPASRRQAPEPGARLDPLVDLGVVDLGDVEMPSGETEKSLGRLEAVSPPWRRPA